MSKKRLAALGASAASAALVGSALFAPSALADEDDGPHAPSAFGLAADGLINMQKTPYVKDDEEDSTLDIPAEDLASSGTLSAAAHPGEASAEVEDLSLLGVDAPDAPGLPDYTGGLVEVDGVTATCDADGASSKIADLKVAGQEIPIEAGDNTSVVPDPLDKIVQIDVNQQLENDNGTETANALKITLLDGAKDLGLGDLAGQTITVASATCDTDNGDDDGDNGDDDGDNGDNGDDDGDNGDDDGDNGGDNGDGDNGDNGGGSGSQANDDGSAPTPEPQSDHIAVTG